MVFKGLWDHEEKDCLVWWDVSGEHQANTIPHWSVVVLAASRYRSASQWQGQGDSTGLRDEGWMQQCTSQMIPILSGGTWNDVSWGRYYPKPGVKVWSMDLLIICYYLLLCFHLRATLSVPNIKGLRPTSFSGIRFTIEQSVSGQPW